MDFQPNQLIPAKAFTAFLSSYQSRKVYIPVNVMRYAFGLGVFKTEKEAQNAFVGYLKKHKDFEVWISGKKRRYKKELEKEFPGLEKSLWDDEDMEFWDGEVIGCQIECVRGGTLYDFTHMGGWVQNGKPENNNLFKIQKGVLYQECFSVELDWYAYEYPAFKLCADCGEELDPWASPEAQGHRCRDPEEVES